MKLKKIFTNKKIETVSNLSSRGQFHHKFTNEFFVQTLFRQLFDYRGQFHQHMCVTLIFCPNRMRSFLWYTNWVNGKQRFVNISTQIWLKFYYYYYFIEQQILAILLAWKTKFGEIDPRCQFHQCSMTSFYMC